MIACIIFEIDAANPLPESEKAEILAGIARNAQQLTHGNGTVDTVKAGLWMGHVEYRDNRPNANRNSNLAEDLLQLSCPLRELNRLIMLDIVSSYPKSLERIMINRIFENDAKQLGLSSNVHKSKPSETTDLSLGNAG